MKKLIISILMVLGLVSSVNAVNFGPVIITDNAKSVINSLIWADDFYVDPNEEAGTQQVRPLRYTARTIEFDNSVNIIITKKTVDGKSFLQVDNKAEYDVPLLRSQCVSFVKALSAYLKGTSDWNMGIPLVDINNNISLGIADGTVIAIFDSNNKYNHIHTAIYLTKGEDLGGKYIWVIDQNWELDKVSSIHKIYIDGGSLTATNLRNYNVVEY